MEPIKSTAEILLLNLLKRDIDQRWIDWAIEMLENGFESESLVLLAGSTPPYYQYVMHELAINAFEELHLEYSNNERIIRGYACYLIDKVFNGEMETMAMLRILSDLYLELWHVSLLCDFERLYLAKEDLKDREFTYYWYVATRENIDSIITDYIMKYKSSFEAEEKWEVKE
jgi:hypothetical protein